jgi:hypothetical protein
VASQSEHASHLLERQAAFQISQLLRFTRHLLLQLVYILRSVVDDFFHFFQIFCLFCDLVFELSVLIR